MTSRMAGQLIVVALLLSPLAAQADPKDKDDFPFLEATVAQLQAGMASGTRNFRRAHARLHPAYREARPGWARRLESMRSSS